MKKTLLQRLPMFVALPLIYCVGVPLFYVLGQWSEKVNGVEPKSGQGRNDHKTINGVQHYRHAGLRYSLAKWKPVPTVRGFSCLDIVSMYPNEVA